MIRRPKEHRDPELVAIRALAFIAGDAERLERFLSLTGLQPDTIRTGAHQPGFLGGVLQQIIGWEPWLVEFAASVDMAPDDVLRAAAQLSDT